MKVAVINEVSASSRNADIMNALKDCGVELYNVGMRCPEETPQLTYIHTGIMTGILLNIGACDMVIGGCGTGQGYLNSCMQYPNVFCGLITQPLDAWLFSQINGGNCVSLALNKGYGWAGDINLKYIFHRLFEDSPGNGYPPERRESQMQSRMALKHISSVAHKDMAGILEELDMEMVRTIAGNTRFMELIENQVALGNESAEKILQILKKADSM